MTWICGGTMSGYCAVGSFVMATAPAIVIRIAMTIATIGRRTKKAPTGYVPVFSAGAGLRRPARLEASLGTTVMPEPHALQSLDHDPVSRLQALLDHPEVPFDAARA